MLTLFVLIGQMGGALFCASLPFKLNVRVASVKRLELIPEMGKKKPFFFRVFRRTI
jgi:hypothetical protein